MVLLSHRSEEPFLVPDGSFIVLCVRRYSRNVDSGTKCLPSSLLPWQHTVTVPVLTWPGRRSHVGHLGLDVASSHLFFSPFFKKHTATARRRALCFWGERLRWRGRGRAHATGGDGERWGGEDGVNERKGKARGREREREEEEGRERMEQKGA